MGILANLFAPALPRAAATVPIQYDDTNHPGYVREQCEPFEFTCFCPTQKFVDMGYMSGIWAPPPCGDPDYCLDWADRTQAVVNGRYLFVLDPDVGPALYTANEVRQIMRRR